MRISCSLEEYSKGPAMVISNVQIAILRLELPQASPSSRSTLFPYVGANYAHRG